MSDLVVDLLVQGELVRTVPFDRPALRIGRMRENDIVVDSPAASRFHARLQLDGGRVFLEDGGSENGSLVNERRVRGRQELAPGDRIVIGKHELRVRSRRLDESALVDAATAPPDALREEALERHSDDSLRDDEEQLVAPLEAVGDPDPSEFDFEPTEFASPDEDGEALAASLVCNDPADAASAPALRSPALAQFAGLIVQRDGRIDRVVPWEGDEFTVGRSSESDLVLAQEEVSRKHARFVRNGDRYEVHDLGSVNGTLVNGSRVDVHALDVGDVITIEGFELTFVIDREPIAGAMKPVATPAPRATTPASGADLEWEVDGLADAAPALHSEEPRFAAVATMPASGDATIANVMLEEDPLGVSNGPDRVASLPVAAVLDGAGPAGAEQELEAADGLDDLPFADAIDSRKELAAVQPRGSSRAASVQDLGATSAPARIVTLELRLRLDQLSEPLRRALEEAGLRDVVIPADLRLRTD
jgi:pSer/pThr/pTyr-binding forkhead associated (FHA) protein